MQNRSSAGNAEVIADAYVECFIVIVTSAVAPSGIRVVRNVGGLAKEREETSGLTLAPTHENIP